MNWSPGSDSPLYLFLVAAMCSMPLATGLPFGRSHRESVTSLGRDCINRYSPHQLRKASSPQKEVQRLGLPTDMLNSVYNMEPTDLDRLNYGLSHIHCVGNRRWGSEVTTVKPIRTFHISTRCSHTPNLPR